MIARQDDDRLAQALELGPHERDGGVGHAIVVEEVAGDEQQIDLVGERPIDDAPQDAATTLAIRELLLGASPDIAIEVDVGRVKDAEGSAGGHGEQHATFRAARIG